MQRNMSRWLASAALASAPSRLRRTPGTTAWLCRGRPRQREHQVPERVRRGRRASEGGGDERAIIFAKGKPAWQSNPKETEPGAKWTINSIGRDFGNGQPDVHFSTNTGGANCCVTAPHLRAEAQR